MHQFNRSNTFILSYDTITDIIKIYGAFLKSKGRLFILQSYGEKGQVSIKTGFSIKYIYTNKRENPTLIIAFFLIVNCLY